MDLGQKEQLRERTHVMIQIQLARQSKPYTLAQIMTKA